MGKIIKGRTALCVGVNDYGGAANLNGCVRDATNVGDYLESRGFAVSLLTDRAASWAGILGAIAGVVRSADVDSRLVLYYSGHGTFLRDLNGDEADRYDEALVPSDYQTGGFVLDDDLWTIFNDLPSHAALTFISDSCHSGTISRFLPALVPTTGTASGRYLPPTMTMQESHTIFRAESSGLARGATQRSTVRDERALRWANLSMCEDIQVAYEDVQADGQVAGVGTTAMLNVMKRSGSALSLAGLVQRMRFDMGEHRAQNPKLDAGPGQATRTIVSGPVRR